MSGITITRVESTPEQERKWQESQRKWLAAEDAADDERRRVEREKVRDWKARYRAAEQALLAELQAAGCTVRYRRPGWYVTLPDGREVHGIMGGLSNVERLRTKVNALLPLGGAA